MSGSSGRPDRASHGLRGTGHEQVGHSHGVGAPRGRLAVVFALTCLVLIIEAVGASVTGSLALLADAGHMVTDAAGIGIALLAATLARRAATPRRTFGYHRLEILAAMANAVLLLGVGGYVLAEAIRRLVSPPEVPSALLGVFGLVSLAGNSCSILVLRGVQKDSLNARGAFLEVVNDAAGSVAVLLAAAVIALTGWQRADAVASLSIGALILPRSWRLLRESIGVLLEGTPAGIDVDEVRSHILAVPGVVGVHDLHAWMITSGLPVVSAHVVVEQEAQVAGCGPFVLDRLGECLAAHFDVPHSTFQLEPAGHSAHEGADHP